MPNPLLLVIGVVVGAALGALIAYVWLGSVRRQRDLVSTAEREKLLSDAETQMKEMVLEAKEEAHRIRMSLEQEVREARAEIQRSERRVQQKEESIDRKLEDLDRKEQAVTAKELEIGRTRERVNDALAEQVKELERISGMTRVEARTTILTNLEKELSQEMAQKIRQGEEIVKEESEKRARNILVTAMQRVAAEQTAETSVSVVAIPSDEMKGRIIGREGRNIRALEHATGVDLIIDDTPEAVILSGFDPVRREVARVALNHLLVDGRIHPARIEEMVVKARNDVQNRIREEGEQAMFETGVTGLHPELVKLLGTLAFRTSYGQNVLTHSKEVSFLCAMAAAEIGADVALARDAVSAARPGARREPLTTYIKRLEKLESIANSFEGVEKSFAIQAGREIRIIVKPDTIDDNRAQILARDIAKRIEGELSYPGQTKVTVIRETRIVEFAK